MLFNSFEFLLMFLPLVMLVFYLVPPRVRLPVLLISSLVFYAFSGPVHLGFMVISIIWSFACAFYNQRLRTKWMVVVAISVPLSTLYFAKYLGFTLASVGAGLDTYQFFLPILSITLPAGISFYTFQLVAYTVDVHDERIGVEERLINLATFISLFPQLIAGPILRYEDIRDQLSRIASQERLMPDLATGAKCLSIGIFMKIFFSDVLLSMHEAYDQSTHAAFSDGIFSILSFSFVIYYDFWAYSLMAIGLGKLFAINLPRNFLEPYLSASPANFWKRWHVTLSYWIRDYIYLKLGGNRAYFRNITIIFLIVGLWHGAGWNFIVWGGYHACLVLGYRLVRPLWDRMPQVVQIALTFMLVSFGWPLFYLNLADYFEFLVQLSHFDFDAPRQFGFRHWAYLTTIAAWTFFAREERWLWNVDRRVVLDSALVQASLFFMALLFMSYARTFIYFRF